MIEHISDYPTLCVYSFCGVLRFPSWIFLKLRISYSTRKSLEDVFIPLWKRIAVAIGRWILCTPRAYARSHRIHVYLIYTGCTEFRTNCKLGMTLVLNTLFVENWNRSTLLVYFGAPYIYRALTKKTHGLCTKTLCFLRLNES